MHVRMGTNMFQPLMICGCDVGSSPSFKIENVHAIEPRTTMGIKVGRYQWMGEIQVVAVFPSWTTTISTRRINDSTNNIPTKLQVPQRGHIVLHDNVIVQEHDLIEIWKQLNETYL